MSINSNKEEGVRGEVTQLRRIADALDLIIKMVKEDQERSRKYMEEPKPDLPDDVPFAGRL
jgi:hypothetical protein